VIITTFTLENPRAFFKDITFCVRLDIPGKRDGSPSPEKAISLSASFSLGISLKIGVKNNDPSPIEFKISFSS